MFSKMKKKIWDLFKKRKGRDIGFFIHIENKIPYTERREKVGNYIKDLINQFYEHVAVQYFHEGKENCLTGVRVVGGNARFKYSEQEQIVRHILYKLTIFFINNKIKFDENSIEFYTPQPFKEEVTKFAMETAEAISKKK